MERSIQKTVPVSQDSTVTVDIYGDADAPGLVMVPGVMSDAHGWRHVARSIHAWPSVAVLNRRGRAPSGPLPSGYALHTEVSDVLAVLDALPGTEALFGWSYGGLIALLVAGGRPVPQVIAYEPVIAPFAHDALPQLAQAAHDRDWDSSVEIVNTLISGFPVAHVEALRANPQDWQTLRRMSEPLHAELTALNELPPPDTLAEHARRVDLIIGETSIGTAPYGTSSEDVRRRIRQGHAQPARVAKLPGQGHLAHVDAPAALGGLIDALAARP
jgi:pimeloyl-ACP methyl ester carboxylesterase